ncbi:MAG: prepilin-type N-terminal cleavage/methylation domain-containing protein [wastewater metagenome]|nr:prepilin-type N-terminal cleavage/methylation domain-containing protein [Candidatus Loosdrechtia aerotolerans]
MKCNKGFTLFELLIAVFIGTILIMSSAYAIRMGLFSMDREESWFNDSTKEKAAFHFFWQQVSSLYVLKEPDGKKTDTPFMENRAPMEDKSKEAFFFIGEKDVLSFASPLSLKKHYGQGMIIANYKTVIRENGKRDLVYLEFKVDSGLKDVSEELENRLITGKENTIFFADCDTISFKYLVKEETGSGENIKTSIQSALDKEIRDAKWKEEVKGEIPKAIKLIVSRNGDQQEIISPIMATY